MASSRGPTNRLRVQDLAIAEDVKINIERALRIFVEDESAIGKEMIVMLSLTSLFDSRQKQTINFPHP